jgi:hypothetical protein
MKRVRQFLLRFKRILNFVAVICIALALCAAGVVLYLRASQVDQVNLQQQSVWITDECVPDPDPDVVTLCAESKFQGYVVTWADQLALNSTGEIRFWVDPKLAEQFYDNEHYKAMVTVISDSFIISPPGPVTLDLVQTRADRVLITPKELGQRKILLRSTVGPAKEGRQLTTEPLTLDVTVVPAPAFLGLSQNHLSIIRDISTAIGIPMILLALINFWLSRKRPSPEPERSRLIIP